MPLPRTWRLPVIGALATAFAVTAAFHGPAPHAEAATVTHEVSCKNGVGADFTWKPQVDLTLSPAKETYDVGDEVAVVWNWTTPPRNPYAAALVLKDTARPTGTVKVSGAQSGTIAMTGTRTNEPAGMGQPLYVSNMVGTFTVTAEGRIDLAPADYGIEILAFGPYPCTAAGTPAVSVSLTVGTPDGGTPGGGSTGDATGSPTPTGATSAGTTTGSTGGGATGQGTGGAGTVPSGGPVPIPGPAATTAVPDPARLAELLGLLNDPTTGAPGARTAVPGPLFMSQADAGVTLEPFVPGSGEPLDGRLNPIVVRDLRGSTLGWTLTAQMGDFVGPDGSVVPADRLLWAPTCVTVGTAQSSVTSGLPGPAAHAEVLCRQPPSDGAVTGGEFRANADLTLRMPADARADSYAALLTLSLS